MTEPTPAQGDDQGQVQELQSQITELTDLINKQKTEISGLDKKVGSLQKEKQELENARVQNQESAEELLKARKQELESTQNELKAAKREKNVFKALSDAQLDTDLFAGRVQGDTLEEIEADVKAFSEMFNKAAHDAGQQFVKETYYPGGDKPKDGGAPEGVKEISRDEFDKLNPAEKIEISRKIREKEYILR